MRILTWNIQWGRGADGRVSLDRSIDVLRQAGELDLICLQEVASNVPGMPGGDCGDQPAELAEAFPGWSVTYAPGVDVPDGAGGRATFGNLLLSRLPVGQVCRHMLPMPGDASVPGMRRSCVEAVIESAKGPLPCADHAPRVLLLGSAPSPGKRTADASGGSRFFRERRSKGGQGVQPGFRQA